MKKLMMVLAFLPMMAAADRARIDGVEWPSAVIDDKATVSRVPSETTGVITIPSVLGGRPVASIDEKRVSQIKLGLVYDFDRAPGVHWLVHMEEVADDEYFAIPVTGAASASEINPVVLHHNSLPSDVSSIEIWTDAQMFDAVLNPVLALKSKWRTRFRYGGTYIECPTSGEVAVWPADMWPDNKAVTGRFWIVAKPTAGIWYGMRDFRVGLFGTDEVTERIYLANESESTYAPTASDKACLDTKRVTYAGRSAPRAFYGQTFCPGGIGSWGDCLGGTMFKTEGVCPASFTATVKEPGMFVLSVADGDYIWDERTQTGHYIGKNFKSQMTVSGGKIVSDMEESIDDRLDAEGTNLYWRHGGGGCVRRITVGDAGTYTFASKSQGDICTTRFHFFPRNRDSVAIDAICMESKECNSCTHDIARGYVLGSGVYVVGETATFTAVPAPGERFDHWETAYGELPKGLDLESPKLSFAVTSDMCGAMEEECQVVIRAVWKKKYRPEIIPSPVGAAIVSGNGSVFPGEEVRMTLIPAEGCSFERWIDGSAAGLSRKFSFAEAERDEPYRAIFTGTPARLTPQGGSLEVVPGEAVSFDTGLIGYTAKGLPSGLKYDKKTGKITGAAKKPTAAEGVTVKFSKKGEADVTMTVVVGPIPTINVTLEGDTEKCKVTGGNKAYLVGKKVSLQAKGPKGTAFVGWFKDGEPWPSAEESKNTKLSYVMTKESISLVATFEKEKMSVACPGLASASFTVGVAGGAEGMPIEIETQSGVKSVAVSKLPTGMKYDKKTGLIVGAPTKAGSFDVTIKVTAKSGAVEALVVPIKVEPLPDWLVGTYEGWFHDVYYGDVSWDDGVVGEWGGRAILTVSSSGIVSGKMVGSDGEHPIQKAQISRAVDGGFECNVRSDHDTAVCIVFSKTNVAGRDRGMATANWRHVNKWNEHIESTVVGWQNRWKDGSGNKLSPAFVKGTVMPICMENMLEACGSRRGLPYGGWLTLKYDKDGSLRTAFSEMQGGKATATGSAQMVPCDLGDDGRIKLLTTVVLKPKNREPFALVLDLSVPGEGSISEGDVVMEDYFLSAE